MFETSVTLIKKANNDASRSRAFFIITDFLCSIFYCSNNELNVLNSKTETCLIFKRYLKKNLRFPLAHTIYKTETESKSQPELKKRHNDFLKSISLFND